MSIKKVICITGAIVIFVLSIKSFYFDTNLGYTMEASPFSTTGCPLFIEAVVADVVLPFLVYGLLNDLCDNISSCFSEKINAN